MSVHEILILCSLKISLLYHFACLSISLSLPPTLWTLPLILLNFWNIFQSTPPAFVIKLQSYLYVSLPVQAAGGKAQITVSFLCLAQCFS